MEAPEEIPKPYTWLKEEKWRIPQGATYHDPRVTLTQYAGWITEYVKKYYSSPKQTKAANSNVSLSPVSIENISDEFSKAAQEVESDWDMYGFSGTIYEEFAREVFNRYIEKHGKGKKED